MEGQKGTSVEIYLLLEAMNEVPLSTKCSDGSKPA